MAAARGAGGVSQVPPLPAAEVTLAVVGHESCARDERAGRSFIDLDSRFALCTSPKGCANVVKCSDSGVPEVHCECGFWFCTVCGMEAHAPATCAQERQRCVLAALASAFCCLFVCQRLARTTGSPRVRVQFTRWKDAESAITNGASISKLNTEFKKCPKWVLPWFACVIPHACGRCKVFIEKSVGCKILLRSLWDVCTWQHLSMHR